jgi:hypothetical protein
MSKGNLWTIESQVDLSTLEANIMKAYLDEVAVQAAYLEIQTVKMTFLTSEEL